MVEIKTSSDPAQISLSIRSLARDAHRALANAPSAAALRGLDRRIDLLARDLGDRREGPLGRWLENLRREVRCAAIHHAGPSRVACLCT